MVEGIEFHTVCEIIGLIAGLITIYTWLEDKL